MSKVLIIISSGEESKDKALTGMIFAKNAKRRNLFEDVRLMFFGPSENLIASGEKEIMSAYKDLVELNVVATGCIAIAQSKNIEASLKEVGLELEPVGPTIATLIGDGYVPMVF